MLEAKLSDSQVFKRIVEAIKDLVNEANFDCNPSGITLQAMDSTHVALATLLMRADEFESFRCDRNIPLGINLSSLTKILKSANASDSITLRAKDSGDSLSLMFESPNRTCEYDLKLMALDTEHLGIPEQPYDAMIGMNSNEFQRIVRDLYSLSESVSSEHIKFEAKGEIGSGSISLKPRDTVDKDKEAVNLSVSKNAFTTLSLKFLSIISKACPLSDRVIIGICEEQPVSIEFKIGQHGYLRYYLAPKVGEE
ncbi:proliferating cell nuclear antigen [Mitosporidium daphniae]|uniref:DNA sliding clamp PCNA n=1 Tax=Mitosporidium daphniae TaxID=1485682 RepID=A0A098VR31_9MICR|nr:proliferating cell nuclear antigen [Mitosporidium daphniae]XP_013236653.1 proliferating cell nuclear antigen [Mitosporidium daphniae]KGG50187.1 proliferating cell nuclear antigen [Mitosporidium daphniae]KGG50211.1 proliferating cell nuclear antigen [Mitosporidium daphniae]|eukprot:XP_013236630.1 proliferating cell nuclear antigen [Mitosporidium daphniae]